MRRDTSLSRSVNFSDLPRGIRRAAIARVEANQKRASAADLVGIREKRWAKARLRFESVRSLAEGTEPLELGAERLATSFAVSERTVRRWVRAYRRNPDVAALISQPRGPRPGLRRLPAESERLLSNIIDVWAARKERLPVSWIVEECRRLALAARTPVPGRTTVEARLRDRGLEGLYRRYSDRRAQAGSLPAMPSAERPLQVVQIDHTLVDVMVVDQVHRQSLGRPWISVAFDIATRAVLGFHLSLNAPSATSVGMVMAMACLPKHQWLLERSLKLRWAPAGIPRLLSLDNAKEFHSVALRRGCEKYGIILDYRPPGRPQFGGHIERYLGTLMRRIHGLPGTTYSNPLQRGKYRSEARASLTMKELERWIALEIDGRYHQSVHSGLHAVPAKLWTQAMRGRRTHEILDPERLVMDFLPAQERKVGSHGFQMNRIRYWDTLLSRVFPVGARVLVRFDPTNLSRVYIPSPTNDGYLSIPYADLRRPPISLGELERIRSQLAARGTSQPTEDLIFKTVHEQRRLEEKAAVRTRKARRGLETRPPELQLNPSAGPKINYKKRVSPYKGEVW